jgi:serine/threonine protein kinase
LVEIGAGAFKDFVGNIQFVGSPFPKLTIFGSNAFQHAGFRANTMLNTPGVGQYAFEDIAGCENGQCTSSTLEFSGLESLTEIRKEAFNLFRGTLKFTGAVPRLELIGERAMAFISTTMSVFDIHDAWSLKRIETLAFESSSAKLRFTGALPQLLELGAGALKSASNRETHMNITCTSGSLALDPTYWGLDFFVLNRMSWINIEPCTCDDWPCDYFDAPGTTSDAPSTESTSANEGKVATTKKSSTVSDETSSVLDVKKSTTATAVTVVAGVVVLMLVVVGLVHRRRQHSLKHDRAKAKLATDVMGLARNRILTHFEHIFSGKNDDRTVAVQTMATWLAACTIPAGKVKLGSKIGDGRFGPLHNATVYPVGERGQGSLVVAKACSALAASSATAAGATELELTPNERDQLVLFAAEAYLIGAMYHPNVVPVVAVIMNTLPMRVMTEHMRNGDLKSYLRGCRPTARNAKEKLGATQLLHVCSQVASACVYLEGLKVVHRGVMSSNVLVGKDHTEIKLSGFGSLREVLRAEEYVQTSAVKESDLDIRFMAPECFTDNTFSTKSDVWSFAVLVWEVMSFARKPYGTFNPSEIAAEVRAGRRLDRAEACPVELHDWMEKSWLTMPANRPAFSTLQGAIRLLLLEDSSQLRARVAAATKHSASTQDDVMRWSLPMRGWEPTPIGPTDCGKFQLLQYRTVPGGGDASVASAGAGAGAVVGVGGKVRAASRLGIFASTREDVAALKTVFTVLQDLRHVNIALLVGCTHQRGFSVLFDDCSVTLAAALHGGVLAPTPTPSDPSISSILHACVASQTGQVSAEIHETKAAAVVQMALGLEYLHASQLVHGRLSSAAYYFAQGGSVLRLLVGNVLHAVPSAVASPALSAPPTPTPPSNLRWLPYEAIVGVDITPSMATDVYGLGVLVWELYAGSSTPHTTMFPDDAGLHAAIRKQKAIPPLAYPAVLLQISGGGGAWGGGDAGSSDGGGQASTLSGQDDHHTLSGVFHTCMLHQPQDRPLIAAVVSKMLDAGPDQWEKDRTQLEFIEHLGSGQFGDVQKMATRLFATDGTLEFVAVKMLKHSLALNSVAGYSGYTAGGAISASDRYSSPTPSAVGTATSIKLRDEFLAEIEVMKQFRHPNLVQMLGVCSVTQPNYMILEFSPGGSLDEWLKVNGPKLLKPTAAKLVHLLHQVSLGMLALGEAGIVHRDLAVRCSFLDRIVHSRMPLDPTHVQLKRTCVRPMAFLSGSPLLLPLPS